MSKHRIIVEKTAHGVRCGVCRVPLLKDGVGYYHDPRLKGKRP